jgi:hypothetical protein
MVECNFDEIPETTDYKSVPAGSYVCRIDEVRVGTSRDGSERWSLKLVVDRGDFSGRLAAWDGLTFSERGLPRVKSVFHRLGLQSTGRVKIVPEDLVGRRSLVTIIDDEWTNPQSGERILRTSVPYHGYRSLSELGEAENNGTEKPAAQAEEESLPF